MIVWVLDVLTEQEQRKRYKTGANVRATILDLEFWESARIQQQWCQHQGHVWGKITSNLKCSHKQWKYVNYWILYFAAAFIWFSNVFDTSTSPVWSITWGKKNTLHKCNEKLRRSDKKQN